MEALVSEILVSLMFTAIEIFLFLLIIGMDFSISLQTQVVQRNNDIFIIAVNKKNKEIFRLKMKQLAEDDDEPGN